MKYAVRKQSPFHNLQSSAGKEVNFNSKEVTAAENNFTIDNSFWFTLGALMQQRTDPCPRWVLLYYCYGIAIAISLSIFIQVSHLCLSIELISWQVWRRGLEKIKYAVFFTLSSRLSRYFLKYFFEIYFFEYFL